MWNPSNDDIAAISRNDTARQKMMQECGKIQPTSEQLATNGELPVVTVSYTVEDDYTEAGVPCGWIGRIRLVRERKHGLELIEDVRVFEKPAEREPALDQPSPRIVAKQDELEQLRQMTGDLRRRFGG